MPTIPRIVHHTSGRLTWEEQHLIERTRKMLPDFEFRFWTDADNEALVETLMPEFIDDYRNIRAGVVKADICRCLYLFQFGGIYCDTDYKFYRRPDDSFFTHRCVLGIEEEHNESVAGPKLGNAFMASAPGWDFWLDYVRHVFSNIRGGITFTVSVGGPHALTRFVMGHERYRKEVTLLPAIVLFPKLRFLNLLSERTPETVGVHLCWGGWRNKPVKEQIRNRLRRWLTALG